jgi:SAM-dependent methyltransferase
VGFGSVADRYDRARPSYPTALIDDLMAQRPRSVLDVGCGTGKAGRLLAARECEVLGVEPDERMAAVAQSHGLAVEVTPFEMWDPKGRTFDLVISAQAWHWVDPAVGPAKARSILREGGRLAAFWNCPTHSDPVRAALDKVYQQHVPELVENTTALGMGWTDGSERLAGC